MNPEQLKQWLDEGKITPEVYLSLLNQPQTSQQNQGNQGGVSLNTTGNANLGNITINNYANQEIPTPAVDEGSLLSKYLKHVIRENRYLDLYGIRSGGNNTPVELEKIYITLRATSQRNLKAEEDWLKEEMSLAPGERPRRPVTSGAIEVVSVNEALKAHSNLVVLGDPGSGKTTLLRYLALLYGRDLAQNSGEVQSKLNLKESGSLPILLPLRDIGRYIQKLAHNPHTSGLEGSVHLLQCLLEKLKSERLELPLTFFDPYLESGRAVILLDGLDEVADPELRRRVSRLVEHLARHYPDCRYVVTSRIKGYDGSRLQGEFVSSTVRDFSLEDIHLFLTHWHQVAAVSQHGRGEFATRQAQQKTANLLQAIQANPRIQELAINPLLLTVIALIYEEKPLSNHRATLYEEAVALLITHWNEAKGLLNFLPVNQQEFDADDQRLLLQKLAFYLQEQEIKEIELHDLRGWLTNYFKQFGVGPRELPKVIKRFLEIVELRTGLLTVRGMGVYSFSHLTFQEYLAAVEIAGRDDYLDYVLARCGQSWWREVVLLVAGHLCEGGITRPTALISAIANHPDETEPHYNLVLAADCLRDCEGRVKPELREALPRQMRQVLETPFPEGKKEFVGYRGNVVMGLVRLGAGFWSQPYGEPEWVEIPAGEFVMGYDKGRDNEKPAHQVTLPSYKIARVPITNTQYLLFVQATGHRIPQHWENNLPPKGKEVHPVVNVNWDGALAYCRWLSEVTGKQITLPTEEQWEKAARGIDGRLYPWGNEFDQLKCNSAHLHLKDTSPVGIFPAGASPYGVLEIAGNVWEWTSSFWTDSYKTQSDSSRKVLRGGSWRNNNECFYSSYRYGGQGIFRFNNFGFRCVWNLD